MREIDDVAGLFKSFGADPKQYKAGDRNADRAEGEQRWSLMSMIEAQLDDKPVTAAPDATVGAEAQSRQQGQVVRCPLPASGDVPTAVPETQAGHPVAADPTPIDPQVRASIATTSVSADQTGLPTQARRPRAPVPARTELGNTDSLLSEVFIRLAQTSHKVDVHPLKKLHF